MHGNQCGGCLGCDYGVIGVAVVVDGNGGGVRHCVMLLFVVYCLYLWSLASLYLVASSAIYSFWRINNIFWYDRWELDIDILLITMYLTLVGTHPYHKNYQSI